MSYLMQGRYALREGMTHDGNVLLSWGLWEIPDAENDERFDTEPELA